MFCLCSRESFQIKFACETISFYRENLTGFKPPHCLLDNPWDIQQNILLAAVQSVSFLHVFYASDVPGDEKVLAIAL